MSKKRWPTVPKTLCSNAPGERILIQLPAPKGAGGAEGNAPLTLRMLKENGARCATCGHSTGKGLVGHRGDEACCATCLFDIDPSLAMVPCLVAISRWYREQAHTVPQEIGLQDTFLIFLDLFESVLLNHGQGPSHPNPLFAALARMIRNEEKAKNRTATANRSGGENGHG